MLSGKKPNCELCGYVFAHINNVDVLEITSKYISYMVDGMGAPNIVAVEKILDIENYKGREREYIRGKILIYLSESLRAQHEEYSTDGSKHSTDNSSSRHWQRPNSIKRSTDSI